MLAFLLLGQTAMAGARDQLRIVGSSTVYPYAKQVGKNFAKNTGLAEPLIKSTGSGGGFKLFCAGTGPQYPDISNASRPMKKSEWELCKKNGVDNITEIHFGNDGLTLVEAKINEIFNITRLQLYKAIAKKVPIDGKMVENPYRNWRQISSALPDRPIQIYGMTKAHGSYDVLIKKVLYETCQNDLEYFRSRRARLTKRGKFGFFLKSNCSQIRMDGIYIAADQPLDQNIKLINANPKSLAIIGYAELFPNRKKMQAVRINGVEPRIYTISDGSYLLSRPLFFYIKNEHRQLISSMQPFLKEFMSERAMGAFGYLSYMGLGGLSLDELKDARYAASIGRRIRRFSE